MDWLSTGEPRVVFRRKRISVSFCLSKGILSHGPYFVDPVCEISSSQSQSTSMSESEGPALEKETAGTDLFEDLEPKVRQQVRIVGRTMFCFRCEGSKEVASYYCPCGSFLCAIHLAQHSCLVSSSMQYNDELKSALC